MANIAKMSKVVFTNGCFDILHVGHFKLLVYCRKLAGPDGTVVVGIDNDEKIRRDKGSQRPIFDLQKRSKALYDLSYPMSASTAFLVDSVVPFDSNSRLESIIRTWEPDYIVKGSDWEGRHVVGSDLTFFGGRKPIVFHYRVEPEYSTTKIIEAIQSKK